MATVNKDFRVKHGLVVEGTNATIDGSDIITEDAIVGGTQTNVTVTYDAVNKVVNFAAESGLADGTTDDLDEGDNNLYFTDARAVDAVENAATSTNTADKIVQRDENGSFAAQDVTVSTLKIGPSQFDNNLGAGSGGSLGISSAAGVNITSDGSEGLNLFAYDGDLKLWSYDSANIVLDALGTGDVYKGSAAAGNEIATVGNIEDHSDLTTGVHGVTGDVVGTTDTQDLSNKRVIDTLYFTDGVTIANEAEVAVKPTTHEFEIKANYGNLDLKTVATGADVNITSQDGDIILSADGDSYLGSAAAGNEIATKSDIDDLTTDDIEEVNGATNLYYTDSRARQAVSAGDGINYSANTGEISADLGNGLQINGTGQIEIDNNVVATQTDLSDDIDAHSDLTTGVHGVSGDVVGTSDTQTLTNKALGSGTTLGASVDAEGFTITNLAAPSQASDAATKGYVDAVSEGLHVHEQVHALVTTPLATITGGTVTYNNGTNGVGATLTLSTALDLAGGDLDGDEDIVVTDRVLIVGETNTVHNGVYVITSTTVLTRASDFDTPAEMAGGDFIFVTHGTTYADTGWVLSEPVTAVGTDPVLFIQFSGAGTYTAGNGLTLDGTEFSIDTSITATNSYVDGAIDDHVELTDNVHGVTGSVVGTSDTQTLTNKTLGSGSVLGANLDGVNTYKVVNLVDPTSNQDATTKYYVDTNFVNVADLPGELDDYILLTQKGADNGVATLDEDGQVPTSQLGHVTEAIDGLTTTDIEEGTNLYFTDVRAVTALESVIPNFDAVNLVGFGGTQIISRQVASKWTNVSDPDTPTESFLKTEYRSAKYLVKIASGTHTELSEILLTLDTSDNIAITEYAVVGTNGSLATISADVSPSDKVRLLITPTNANSIVTITGTWLA